jgi:Spy/CpxP family protein refolding chaperone
MKQRAVIGAMLAVAVCATVVWSQGPPPGRGGLDGPMMMSCPAMADMPPPPGMFDRMAGTLQLTHDQLAKLKKACAKSDQRMKPLRKPSADATKALRTALTASDFSAKRVKDLAAKAERSEANIVAASIDNWTQIRSILSKSQAAKLQKAMSMHGPGPGGPPPPPPGQ